MTIPAGQDIEQGEHASVAGGSINLHNSCEISVVVPQKDGNNIPQDLAMTLLGIFKKNTL